MEVDRSAKPKTIEGFNPFELSNDRGMLVGVGTTRLPLDRHLCAETLWRFFGDMGDPDETIGLAVVRLRDQIRKSGALTTKMFPNLERLAGELLDFPSFAASKRFSEGYCLNLFQTCKRQGLEFVKMLFQYYQLLDRYDPVRPDLLDQGNWHLEIILRRQAKWIMRMDYQYGNAVLKILVGDAHFKKDYIADAAWYYVRALFDICPWYPTEWWLSAGAELMYEFPLLIWHCLNRLAFYAWRLGSTKKGDVLAQSTAVLVAQSPFAAETYRVHAARLSFRLAGDNIRKKFDRSASWEEVVGDDCGLPRELVAPVWPEYCLPSFCVSDVVRWASTNHHQGVPSVIWDFNHTNFDEIMAKGIAEWRRVYGPYKKMYVWDGTEDEALGDELGQSPDVNDTSLGRLVLLT